MKIMQAKILDATHLELSQPIAAHPGDVIIIPPNVPHAWSEVPSPIVYLDIRIDPEQVLKLK